MLMTTCKSWGRTGKTFVFDRTTCEQAQTPFLLLFQFQFVSYYHFYLLFPSDQPWFLPDVEFIVNSDERRGYYTVWQNFEVYRPGCRIVQGAATHEEARRINGLTGALVYTLCA